MRPFVLLLCLLLWCASAGVADGTLQTSDLLNSLRASNPQLVQTLEKGFDLDKDATAVTIGRAVNPKLSGVRIGPYTIAGSLRGAESPRLTITLNTELTFTNARGSRISRVAFASAVREQLKSFTITTRTP